MIERLPSHPAPEPGTPRHVALVVRGGEPHGDAGPREAAAVLRDAVLEFASRGIAIVSVYAPPSDAHLVDPVALEREAGALRRGNVRVDARGTCAEPVSAERAALASLQRRTAGCDGTLLVLMPGYSARADVRAAVAALARDVRDGRRRAPSPGDDALASYLATAGLPDPDLLIATGGSRRIEDFLLYEIAYAELWSTNEGWATFDARQVDDALRSFTGRQRRFGT